MSSLGPQFTAYRGMIVAKGPVPESNEEILGHLRSKSPALPPSGILPNGSPSQYYRHPFGEHWTTERSTAERFATTPNAGGYETLPSRVRQFEGGGHYGVVIEGQIHTDRRVHPKNGGMYGRENEVNPLHDELQHAVAHVVQWASPQDRRAARLAGRPEPQGVQTLRSFEIPSEHWRPS